VESKKEVTGTQSPLGISRGLLSDIRRYFLKKPQITTAIKYKSKNQREFFSQRIMQRIGIDVANYSVLNIHQIGIDAPVSHVFEELLKWDGNSIYWPNSIAKVDRNNNRLEDIRILLFGLSKYPFGIKNGLFGLKYIPLFNLNKIKFQDVPDPVNYDNARYLLFECSGGYPIGIFAMYVRSSIKENHEIEQSQLFMVVGFNFYGKEKFSNMHFVNKLWESIHNRFTANIMNRFKYLCEWDFEKIKEGAND
jgi:hypothetical protein